MDIVDEDTVTMNDINNDTTCDTCDNDSDTSFLIVIMIMRISLIN